MADTSSNSRANHKVYFIGYNVCGEFGLGGTQSFNQLTLCPNKQITKVFSGSAYSIYSNDDFSKIWSCGHNKEGECGVNQKHRRITTYTPIEYFNRNNIKIFNIFLNNFSHQTYFLADNGQLYACGQNDCHQMGWNDDEIKSLQEQWGSNPCPYSSKKLNLYEPRPVEGLSDVISVKSGRKFCIALCSTNNEQLLLIITNWCRLYNVHEDVISLLIMFTKVSSVFSTTDHLKLIGCGHEWDAELPNKYGWNEIMILKNKNIIKIAAGERMSFFLEDTGVLWTCGRYNVSPVPVIMRWFVDRDIKIKDVDCGKNHALILTQDGNVYSWGSNNCGQCGVGHQMQVESLTIIQDVKKYFVTGIKCGFWNSYLRTECDKHFLFGSNGHGQCLKSNNETFITRPYRFDQGIKDKFKIKCISDVSLGYQNTKIVCVV